MKQKKIWKMLATTGLLALTLVFALFITSCNEEEQEGLGDTKVQGNTDLESFTVNEGVLSPEFSNKVFDYTVDVANSVHDITITAVLVDLKASIEIISLDIIWIDIQASTCIFNATLDVGKNIIEIVVIDRYGSSQIYTLTVNRSSIVNLNVADFDITGIGIFDYDGTPKIVNITAKDNKTTGEITVLYNGSVDEPVNAGEYFVTFNIVALEGYNEEINGLEAGTIIINKIAGEDVGNPTAAVIGMNSITLNIMTTSTGQDVEYAYFLQGAMFTLSNWQTDPVFTGLTAGTTYLFYARSASNNNYNASPASSATTITTKQQAGVNIISYWADYDGTIGIKRQDNEPIANNIISVVPGGVIVFTPKASGYLNHRWTLNGISAENGLEYTFETADKESDKNYIVGLYVEKDSKPYFTQIIVMIRSALTGTVSINGNAQVGQTLTANTSNLGGSGTIFYQWNRSDIAINSANNGTYIVQDDDRGNIITVTVSRSGNSGTVTSAPTATVPLSPLTGTISIVGASQVGVTLSVNTNNLGGSGTISYQWLRNGITQIGFNSTYTVQSSDIGSYIEVRVTRSGNSGSVSAYTSTVPDPFVATWEITEDWGGLTWTNAILRLYSNREWDFNHFDSYRNWSGTSFLVNGNVIEFYMGAIGYVSFTYTITNNGQTLSIFDTYGHGAAYYFPVAGTYTKRGN